MISTFGQSEAAALERCLTDSSTGKDRQIFVKWVVFSLAQHPVIQSTFKVPPDQIEQAEKDLAAVLFRLMTVDRKSEMRAAVKNGLTDAVEQAFGRLGAVATVEVMTEPSVSKSMQGFLKHIDFKKIVELFEEN